MMEGSEAPAERQRLSWRRSVGMSQQSTREAVLLNLTKIELAFVINEALMWWTGAVPTGLVLWCLVKPRACFQPDFPHTPLQIRQWQVGILAFLGVSAMWTFVFRASWRKRSDASLVSEMVVVDGVRVGLLVASHERESGLALMATLCLAYVIGLCAQGACHLMSQVKAEEARRSSGSRPDLLVSPQWGLWQGRLAARSTTLNRVPSSGLPPSRPREGLCRASAPAIFQLNVGWIGRSPEAVRCAPITPIESEV